MSKEPQGDAYEGPVEATATEDTGPAEPEPEKPQTWALVRRSAALTEADWPDERLSTVWKMAAPAAKNLHQLSAFLAVCQRYGLDPIMREAWLMETDAGPQVVTGRDALLKAARRDDPDYLGFDAGVVREKDEFTVERDGSAVVVHHKVTGIDRGPIAGAYCVAYHRVRKPVFIVRAWDDFKHLHRKKNWTLYPEDMLETRVIVAAHRRLCNLAGIYEQTEIVPDSEATASAIVADKTRAKIAELRGETP